MKRFLLLPSVAIVTAVAALPALAASDANSASVVIRHQTRGCHTWALNGGTYKADLAVRLARGATLTITNNDLQAHKLVQQAGARVRIRTIVHEHMKSVGLHKLTGRGVMSHMGAAVKVRFAAPGVYRFTTKGLGDYFEFKEAGEHNHLMLTVRVS